MAIDYFSFDQDHPLGDSATHPIEESSSPFHQNAYMKSRLFPPGVVARRCHSYGYVASSRLARPKNPSISLCNHFDETNYQVEWCMQRPAMCLLAMEFCSRVHCWAPKLLELGLGARIIAAHLVTPYHQQGRGGKNDANDASAICEAASRPTMRYVAVKTVDQQSMLSVHFTNLTPRMCIASLMVPTNPFSRQFKAVELLFLTAGPR